MNNNHIEPSKRNGASADPVSPNRFNAEVAQKILESIGAGIPREDAAAQHDVDPHTFAAWIERHPDFIGQIRKAEAQDIGRTLYKLSLGGPFWRPHAWKLKHRYPDRFDHIVMARKTNPTTAKAPPAPASTSTLAWGYDPAKGVDKEMCDRMAADWAAYEKEKLEEKKRNALIPDPPDPN